MAGDGMKQVKGIKSYRLPAIRQVGPRDDIQRKEYGQ